MLPGSAHLGSQLMRNAFITAYHLVLKIPRPLYLQKQIFISRKYREITLKILFIHFK